MFTRLSKIKKGKNVEVDATENAVAQILYDLQISNEKLKGGLKEVYITAAKELDIGENKKAVVVFVPVPQLPQFQKLIRDGLLEELEKKLSGKSVVIIAERRIVRKESRKKDARALRQPRPRSRTLTAVHESILEDLVFPTEIVGKRLRYKVDGSRVLKVYLQQESKAVSDKTDAFAKIYKTLTSKDVTFESPVHSA